MNLVDGLIILVIILGLMRGYAYGLLRRGLSLVGFFLGLGLGSWLAQGVVPRVDDAGLRAILGLGLVLGVALALAGAGELVGGRLSGLARRFRLGWLDRSLGAGFELAAILVSIWLLAALVVRLPASGLARAVHGSTLIAALDSHFPPAPGIIARLEQLIAPNGFPRVYIGDEPNPVPAAGPAPMDVQAALAAAGRSTVKVEGPGCGGLVEGSGFVAAADLVITNAHVVAGVRAVTVLDARGRHVAMVIWFNPNLDLAVLRTTNLAGPPLPIDKRDAGRGLTGAVLGYPGGGVLTAGPATVLDERTAGGRNIYDQGFTTRAIYELQANIEPGNSGGPLVTSTGLVVGVVFARSVDTPDLGYALTGPAIFQELQQAEAGGNSTTTGDCASG